MDAKQPSLTGQMHATTGSYELAASGVIFGLLGFWLDRKFGTTPWLIIGGTLFGFIGSGISMYYRFRNQTLQFEQARLAAQAARRNSNRSVVAPADPSVEPER